eukprot:TRINITY_DN4743_c0_g1_i1.p1 TRINITY_DN4743_c0_g1~~TRINITY_DN4743_c0_g1_i1.p1  ORF type:complete len:221 (+),score=26.05 TRINITY_DN4743_c0_g1_i1:78-740(+)
MLEEEHQLARVKGLPSDMTPEMLKKCKWCTKTDLHLSEEGFVRCMTCISVCSCVTCYEGVRDTLEEVNLSQGRKSVPINAEEASSPIMSPSSVFNSIKRKTVDYTSIMPSSPLRKPSPTWTYLECIGKKGGSYKRRYLSSSDDSDAINLRSSSDIQSDGAGLVVPFSSVTSITDCPPSSDRLAKLGVSFALNTTDNKYIIVIPTGYSSWRSWLTAMIEKE